MVTSEVNCQRLEISEEMLFLTEVTVVAPSLAHREEELELVSEVMFCQMDLEAGQVTLLVLFTQNITETTGGGLVRPSGGLVDIVGVYRALEHNADTVCVEGILELGITGGGIQIVVDRGEYLTEV